MSVVLSEHLPLLASAPDGIQKLRGLILELAVRGKLVSQDSTDESASELLKRIIQERTRLEAEGFCKKSKATPLAGEDGQPFELPKNWTWTNLATVALINPRNAADDSIEASFVPMAMIGSRFEGSHQQEFRKWGEVKQGFTHFAEGDIGVAKITPCFENSKACVFSGLKNAIGAGTTELHVVRPIGQTLSPRYVLAYLKSPMFLLVGETKMTGTAGQKRLPKDFLEANPFPLPPLAEQHRIVAKVDELMALCDLLEAEQADAASAHARLVETLLGTLTQSTDAADLAANWQRLAEHFDTMFTTEASIDALKRTVLQLAVTGFLVPSERTEKADTGKLGDYVEFLNGYAFKSEWFKPSGIRLLRNANVGHGVCDWRDVVYLEEDHLAEFDRFRLYDGDLVLSLDRPIINTGLKIARVTSKDLPCLLLQRVAKVLPREGQVSLDYLYLWFNSPVFLSVIDPGRSNGVPHISTKQVAGLKFVRYPLEAQQSIVAKVDELMALCDSLKADLATARQHQATLADTLIESALEAA